MKIDLKNTWLVIQGPTFWDEKDFKIGGTPYDDMIKIIDLYSNYNNVIWSTWEDSPDFILEYINSKNIYCLINKYPEDCGRGNCNLQKISTLNGINFAKNFNAKYVFKIRTDLYFPQVEKVIEKIIPRLNKTKKLSGLCWDDWTESKFVLDQLLFGEIEHVEMYWNLQNIHGFVERQVLNEYFQKLNIPFHLEGIHESGGGSSGYDFIKNYFDFFMQDLIDLNIDLISYKKYHMQPKGKNYTKHFSHQELHKTDEYPWFRNDWCQVLQFGDSIQNRWKWT
jgi:hypothetical protein